MIKATVIFIILFIAGAAFAASVPLSTALGNTTITGILGAIVFVVLIAAGLAAIGK